MKKFIALILVITSMVCATACSCKQPQDNANGGNIFEATDKFIVKNGETDYSIVIPSKPNFAETTASNELKVYLKNVSGANIAIKSDSDVSFNEQSKIISIGDTSCLNSLKSTQSDFAAIDYDSLENDGFIIKSYNDSVFIVSEKEVGLYYGAYRFLEYVCSVKFLATDYQYCPQMPDVAFYKMDMKFVPDIKYREYFGGTAGDANALINIAMGYQNLIYGGNIEWFDVEGFDNTHNTLYYVPVEKYYTADKKATNYHMYGRENENDIPSDPSDICVTDGVKEDGTLDTSIETSAVTATIETLKQLVLADTDALYFMVGQMDNVTNLCKCDDCVKAADKYGRGGMNIRFCNLVAKAVQEWADKELNGRQIYVVTFAYNYSDVPPVKSDGKGGYDVIDETVRAADNLCIRLAPVDSCPYYPMNDKENQATRYSNWINKWKTVGKKFFIWNYQTNFNNSFVYYPTIQSWSQDLRDYKEMGVEYMLMQDQHSMPNNWQAIMKKYIAGKMLWDVTLDPYELRNEFVKYYYGETVYDDMIAFLTDCDEFGATIPSIEGVSYMVFDLDIATSKVWSSQQLRKQISALDEMIEKTQNSDSSDELKNIYINHIKLIKTTPLCLLLLNYDVFYLNDTKGKVEVGKEFFSLYDEFGIRTSGIDEKLSEVRASLGI